MSEISVEAYDQFVERDRLIDKASNSLVLGAGLGTISALFATFGIEALQRGYVPETLQDPTSYVASMAVGAASTAKLAQHFLEQYRELRRQAEEINNQYILGIPSETLGFPGFHIQ